MAQDAHVVIDIGKSGWRARHHQVAAIHQRDGAPGFANQMIATPEAGTLLGQLILGAIDQLDSQAPLSSIIVGSTAIPTSEQLDVATHLLRQAHPRATIVLAEDGVLAHASAVGGPGVCASVGTGLVVTALDAQGRLTRHDGWGPDLGDRGSAFDLGRNALRTACAALDGAGIATVALMDAARKHLKGLDLQSANRLAALPSRITTIAAFAQQVCDLAAFDPVASRLVRDAATAVASTAGAASSASSTRRIAVLGRLGRHPQFLDALRAEFDTLGLVEVEPAHDLLALPPELILSAPYRARLSVLSEPC